MADDRERNQGMQQGGKDVSGGGGGGQQAPGRNLQEHQSAGTRGVQPGGQQPGQGSQQGQQPSQQSDFDPTRGADGGSYKEGGQNEQTQR